MTVTAEMQIRKYAYETKEMGRNYSGSGHGDTTEVIESWKAKSIDIEKAMDELCQQAMKLGANALINLKIESINQDLGFRWVGSDGDFAGPSHQPKKIIEHGKV